MESGRLRDVAKTITARHAVHVQAEAFKIACNFVDHSIDRLSIVGWRFDFDPFDDAVEDLLCVYARGVSGGGHVSSIFRIEVQGFFQSPAIRTWWFVSRQPCK